MNKVILLGRLTRDPEIKHSNQGENAMAIARFNLAVDRKFKKGEQQGTDFIGCVVFGKLAEIVEKYCKQGSKVLVNGRLQTGSYTNSEGAKVYTTNVVIDEIEFVESKNSGQKTNTPEPALPSSMGNGFMDIPDDIDEELPFN